MTELDFGKSGRILKLSKHAQKVKPEHVRSAVAQYNAANGQVDSYEASSHYNVVVDGEEYPPKTIFGLALSEALGTQIQSNHFTGGENTPCFNTLFELGFSIVEKKRRLGRADGLEIYRQYSREQMAAIFSPNYAFKAGSGTWGIQGIISDAPNIGDHVLIVTLGSYDGNDYEDYLTEDGVLVWKSQNQHTPESPVIKRMVAHDPDRNTVSLFVRPDEKSEYYFLGPLALRDWDPESSNPVKMTWTVLNWPLPTQVELPLEPAISPLYKKPVSKVKKPAVLVEKDPSTTKRSKSTQTAKSKGPVDWLDVNKRNHELGDAGERLVLQHEIDKLTAAGRPDLAKKVERVSLIDSSAGYDIRSFCKDTGDERFIEVKTTRGGASTPFYISVNEVNVSASLGNQYVLFRVYGYSEDANSISFFIRRGYVKQSFSLEVGAYKASI